MDQTSVAKRKIPMNRAIRETLEYEMTHGPTVFMMGEDIGQFGGIYNTAGGFIEKFGKKRVRDPNPVVFMIHKSLSGIQWFHPVKEADNAVLQERYEVPIGKAFVRHEGSA